MSKATYVQAGSTLDYPNETSKIIEGGSIISFGGRIGVIGGDILPKTVGAIHTEGVFEIGKASEEITFGDLLYYNGTVLTKVSTGNTLVGYATNAAALAKSTVNVKLSK